MKKRFLLLTLIMCLLGGVNSLSLKADEVQIGSEGTGSSNTCPYISNYLYSTTQQIYKASEIGTGGTITKIAFHLYDQNVNKELNDVKVYIKHTDKDAFSSKTDWDKTVTNEHLVYDGNPVITNSVLEIQLDNSFAYNGENNLLVCFDVNSRQEQGNTNVPYRTYSADSRRAIYGRNSATNYGPDAANYYNLNATNYSNAVPVITLTFSSGGSSTPTAPTAPELESPTDGATDVFNQALQFTLGANTSEYKILLNEVVAQDWTTGKSGDVVTFMPQVNYDGTTYTWKVVARCSDGNEGFLEKSSEVRSFTTKIVTAAPGAISNVSPAHQSTNQLNPTLSWTFGENTEEYQVLFAEASEDLPEIDNNKWVNTQNEAEGSYTPSGLVRGTEYKWKVVTKNHINTTESGIYTFTTLDVPAAVTPNPANGATGVSKNVTLTWTYADNTVTGYRVLFGTPGALEYKVGNGSTWATPDGNTGSYEVTETLSPNTKYCWYVDVKNDAGTRGIYGCNVIGEPFTFTTVDDISPVTEYEVKLNDGFITLEWQYADQKANEYQVCFGETEQNIQIWHDPKWKSRETVAETTTLVEDGSFTIYNPGFGNKVYFRVNVRKDGGETVEGETAFYVVLDEDATWEEADNNANDVFVSTEVNVETDITAKNVTIEDGGILTINGTLTKSKLTINDGGQLIGADKLSGTSAIFNMAINRPETWLSENKDGWQFISSPFTNSRLDDFTNGIEGDYDLYKYDASTQIWFNYKEALSHGNAAVTFGSGFTSGIGYLASYQTEETATLTGNLNEEVSFETSLTYNAENELASIHLLGNPFPFDMDIARASFTNLVEGFAVVTAEGGYDYSQETIPAGDGFFVKVIGAGASFSYDHNYFPKSRNAEQSKSLNIIAAGNAGNDNVVVNFAGEGEGFPKLQNFNDDIATVYVQNNDANYGIYNCDENTTEIELCFNANQMGNYTISVEPTGEFSSIVLVDRFTGIETNLLVDDYHFTAMSDANNNRFIVKLAVSDQQSAVSDNFVYQSGEELIIEAEGTVQIIDVMGRVVYNSNVENNRINVSDFNNGTYVVRVINETGVKVEKVVIY